jgi:hypothetical protein
MSVTCVRCGLLFHVKPSRLLNGSRTRFCSRVCRSISNDPAHFWERVDIREPNECWPWKGNARVRDYGHTFFEGRPELAHRVSFKLTYGYWPENARHTCDNPPCCNPAHFLDGNHADNMADKVKRGRQPRGEGIAAAKLTKLDVRAIRADSRPQVAVAAEYGVHPAHISRIKGSKRWRWV